MTKAARTRKVASNPATMSALSNEGALALPGSGAGPLPGKDPYTDGSGWGAIPDLDLRSLPRDLGSSGLRQFGGWVREEFLRQLQGREAARAYREMADNSSTVGALLFAITQTLRSSAWRVNPANDTSAALVEAEFVESLMADMSHTWEDFVVEFLSMLTYGFAPHEIVYKRRNGRQPGSSPVPNSRFDDGLIGWRRLPLRGQDTILKWFFDENGQVKGLTQQPWVGPMIDLPIEKLLLFRPTAHKNNPEGKSILRNAFRPYFFVKRIQEMEGIILERMSGVPVLRIPNLVIQQAATGDAKATAAMAAYQKLITGLKVDDQMGVIIPSDTFPGPTGPSAVPMYSFELATPQSRAAIIDSNAVIDRYELNILSSVLADFISLGHGSRGTQALSISKIDIFFQALEGWAGVGAEVINRFALPRLYELNGKNLDLMPEVEPDMATRVDLDSLGKYILALNQAGMPMFPDEDLESYLREVGSLPAIPEGGVDRQAAVDLATAPPPPPIPPGGDPNAPPAPPAKPGQVSKGAREAAKKFREIVKKGVRTRHNR